MYLILPDLSTTSVAGRAMLPETPSPAMPGR